MAPRCNNALGQAWGRNLPWEVCDPCPAPLLPSLWWCPSAAPSLWSWGCPRSWRGHCPMCPLTCSVTMMPAGCCHTPGEGTRLGRRSKDRDGPTMANGSFAKRLLMGLPGSLLWGCQERGWREGGGRVEELCSRWLPWAPESRSASSLGTNTIGSFDLWLLGSGPLSSHPGSL